MDPETYMQALFLIRQQCTGEDGELDAERYKAAVAELAGQAGKRVQEACVPNKTGKGHHDDETGHPCAASDGKAADEDALRRGKDVPPEVLAEYPDLAKRGQ